MRLLLAAVLWLVAASFASAATLQFGGSFTASSSSCNAGLGYADNGCAASQTYTANAATLHSNMFGTLGSGGAGSGYGDASGGFYFAKRPAVNYCGIDYACGSATPSSLTSVTGNFSGTNISCVYTASTYNTLTCTLTGNATLSGYNFSNIIVAYVCNSGNYTITEINDYHANGQNTNQGSLVYQGGSALCSFAGYNVTLNGGNSAYLNYLFSNAPGATPCTLSPTCYSLNAQTGQNMAWTAQSSVGSWNCTYCVFLDTGERFLEFNMVGGFGLNYYYAENNIGTSAHGEMFLGGTTPAGVVTQSTTLTAGSPDTAGPIPAGFAVNTPFWWNASGIPDASLSHAYVYWVTSVNTGANTFPVLALARRYALHRLLLRDRHNPLFGPYAELGRERRHTGQSQHGGQPGGYGASQSDADQRQRQQRADAGQPDNDE